MPNEPKIEWPTTYLGRLQAVTNELRTIAKPMSLEAIAQRFDDVTTEQVESILAALILFGRVEKKAGLFQALEEGQ